MGCVSSISSTSAVREATPVIYNNEFAQLGSCYQHNTITIVEEYETEKEDTRDSDTMMEDCGEGTGTVRARRQLGSPGNLNHGFHIVSSSSTEELPCTTLTTLVTIEDVDAFGQPSSQDTPKVSWTSSEENRMSHQLREEERSDELNTKRITSSEFHRKDSLTLSSPLALRRTCSPNFIIAAPKHATSSLSPPLSPSPSSPPPQRSRLPCSVPSSDRPSPNLSTRPHLISAECLPVKPPESDGQSLAPSLHVTSQSSSTLFMPEPIVQHTSTPIQLSNSSLGMPPTHPPSTQPISPPSTQPNSPLAIPPESPCIQACSSPQLFHSPMFKFPDPTMPYSQPSPSHSLRSTMSLTQPRLSSPIPTSLSSTIPVPPPTQHSTRLTPPPATVAPHPPRLASYPSGPNLPSFEPIQPCSKNMGESSVQLSKSTEDQNETAILPSQPRESTKEGICLASKPIQSLRNGAVTHSPSKQVQLPTQPCQPTHSPTQPCQPTHSPTQPCQPTHSPTQLPVVPSQDPVKTSPPMLTGSVPMQSSECKSDSVLYEPSPPPAKINLPSTEPIPPPAETSTEPTTTPAKINSPTTQPSFPAALTEPTSNLTKPTMTLVKIPPSEPVSSEPVPPLSEPVPPQPVPPPSEPVPPPSAPVPPPSEPVQHHSESIANSVRPTSEADQSITPCKPPLCAQNTTELSSARHHTASRQQSSQPIHQPLPCSHFITLSVARVHSTPVSYKSPRATLLPQCKNSSIDSPEIRQFPSPHCRLQTTGRTSQSFTSGPKQVSKSQVSPSSAKIAKQKSTSTLNASGNSEDAKSTMSMSMTDVTSVKCQQSRKNSSIKSSGISRTGANGHKLLSSAVTTRRNQASTSTGLQLRASRDLAQSTRSVDNLKIGSSKALSSSKESLKAASLVYGLNPVSRRKAGSVKKRQPESKLMDSCQSAASEKETSTKQSSPTKQSALREKQGNKSQTEEILTGKGQLKSTREKIQGANPTRNRNIVNDSTGQPESCI